MTNPHGVEPLEDWKIVKYQEAQERDIKRRASFLRLNKPTQQTIVEILTQAAQLITEGDMDSEIDAQIYIQQTIESNSQYIGLTDDKGVDWGDVDFFIKAACFRDGGEWDVVTLVGHRVWPELAIYSSLMEDSEQNEYNDLDF
jgi:hypothetical protein